MMEADCDFAEELVTGVATRSEFHAVRMGHGGSRSTEEDAAIVDEDGLRCSARSGQWSSSRGRWLRMEKENRRRGWEVR